MLKAVTVCRPALQLAAVSIAAATLTGCHYSPKQWTLTPPPKPNRPANVFDVTWLTTDQNGLPVNPVWGSQDWTPNAEMPPAGQSKCKDNPRACTRQRFVEDWAPKPSICRLGVDTGLAGPFAAHFDWTIAAFTGVVRPEVPAISEDNDYNFIFQPAQPNPLAGLTEANTDVPFDATKKYIELELLSHEVDHRFALKWWREFADAADRVVSTGEDDPEAQASIDQAWIPEGQSPRAVVIGLFGVDCEHGCKSELHPVYALAVEADANPAHNVWQIFARNWGNGGSCSTLNHEFRATNNQLVLTIPPPSAAATPDRVLSATFARSDDTIAVPAFSTLSSHDGLQVTLGLAAPAVRGLEELEVAISWAGANAPPPFTAAPPPPPAPRAAAPATSASTASVPSAAGNPAARPNPAAASPGASPRPETEWRYIRRVVNSLPPDRKMAVEKKLVDDVLKRPPRGEERDRVVEGVDTTIGLRAPATPSTTAQPSTPRTKLQDSETDRSRKLWSTLCEATQGQLPTFNGRQMSGICQKVDWKRGR